MLLLSFKRLDCMMRRENSSIGKHYQCRGPLLFGKWNFLAKQEGIKADPIQLRHFLDFLKCGKLQTETFFMGPNQCMMVRLEWHWVL
ncbi:hypothetical protein EUGRSUZ_E01843 [Eucalyptus grandis]|uniref:Uncharacterized protein n=1 Tax=Eucalyptus grandis TaxID=71139 RepID=A0ACC3KVW5_EUCGR|nr:hypothetical protein EUGRSUZ_E01843 [Eucalyptus grandis]